MAVGLKMIWIPFIAVSYLMSGMAVSAELPETGLAETIPETSYISSDEQIARVADLIAGTWKTDTPIQTETLEDGGSEDIFMMMSIEPVVIDGMDHTMYAESVLSGSPWAPFRQAVFQLYNYKGKVRLRTYTIAMSSESLGLLAGMNATPSYFEGVSKEQLIATLDVELDVSGSGFSGSTPYPYPTGVGGAIEMTSSMTLNGDSMTVADRGYDAEGNVVWGAGADSAYTFSRANDYAVQAQREDALIVIDYPSSITDAVVAEGDEMHVDYYGFLGDGSVFDSSYSRGTPYAFVYPPGKRAIDGWGMGMDGLSLDGRRKLIIPGDLAYGPGGNPRANIPGDTTLYFNVHLAHMVRAEPAVEEPDSDGVDATP